MTTAERLVFLKTTYGWDVLNDALYDKQCPGQTEGTFYAHGDSIIRHLDVKVHEVGLNIGCGSGRVEYQWASKVAAFHSVDFASAMVTRARERVPLPNVTFYVNDGVSLSFFHDDVFDFAMAELVFQHIPRAIVKKYVLEVWRVLKSGGRFVCQIPRVSHYGDRWDCGGMSRRAVRHLFKDFNSLSFVENATNGDYYYVPLCVK